MASTGTDVGQAFVTIVPSARGFGDRLEREIGGPAGDAGDRAGRETGSRFSGAMGGGLGLVAGAVAGLGLATVFTGFIADAQEAARLSALTAQTIKTTGSAANVTADQVTDLATAISLKSGMDDGAIQAASNLLLTFTNVRNEVGKGNDIFNQATQTAADMAAVLGGDASSQAIGLGKALNDPIKGVGALSRVGVSFTEQQKEQIKTMVAAGDTLGAQKVILAELGKEFGGAAEAAANPMDKLKNAVGEVGESVGAALLPAITAFAGFAVTYLVPALERTLGAVGAVFRFIDNNRTTFIIAAGIITAVFLPTLILLGIQAGVMAVAAVGAFATTAAAAVSSALAANAAAARVVLGWVAMGLSSLAGAAQIALAWIIAAGPAILIIAAIAAVIAIGVLLYKNFDKIKEVAGTVFGYLRDNWPKILLILTGPFGLAYTFIKNNLDQIKSGARSVVDFVRGAFEGLGRTLSLIWNSPAAAFKALINTVIRGLNKLNFTVPEVDTHLPGIGKVGGFKIGLSNIPELAAGGVVTRPTVVLAGEQGPEAVVPLSKLGSLLPGAGAGALPAVHVDVYIGNERLDGRIDSRVQLADADDARQLAYGRSR